MYQYLFEYLFLILLDTRIGYGVELLGHIVILHLINWEAAKSVSQSGCPILHFYH